MDRFSGTGFATIGGIRQFVDLNLATNTEGSFPNALWFNGAQESLLAPVTATGQVPTDADNTQLLRAIRRIGAGNVSAVTTSTTVTPDQAGIVLVNAVSGNLLIQLPLAASSGGQSLRYRFVREDSYGTTVNLTLSGADTFAEGGPTEVLIPPLDMLEVSSDGYGTWFIFSYTGFLLIASYGTPGSYTFVVPAGVTKVKATVTGGGGGGLGQTPAGSTFLSGGGGGAGGTAIGEYIVAPGSSIPVIVGAGGAGGAASNGWGGNGGTSSFGSFCSATGGSGSGWLTSTSAPGGSYGDGAGGTFGNFPGGFGSDGQNGSQLFAGNGGGSIWGGGGRAGAAPGGGTAGFAPGSGGGGSYNPGAGASGTGGSGAQGLVIVEWVR